MWFLCSRADFRYVALLKSFGFKLRQSGNVMLSSGAYGWSIQLNKKNSQIAYVKYVFKFSQFYLEIYLGVLAAYSKYFTTFHVVRYSNSYYECYLPF